MFYSDYVFFFGSIPFFGSMKQNVLNAVIVGILTYINVRFILSKIVQVVCYYVNAYKEIVRYL